MLRSPRIWLGIAASFLFLGLFLYRTNFHEIFTAFEDANYVLALVALPVYFLGIRVRTIRWQYLLRPVARISVWRLYPVVIIGLTANNLLPARAGELVRAYILGERENVSKAASLGTIAVDRLFDGLTLIPMMVIVALIVGNGAEFPLPLVDVSVGYLGLAVIMAVLFGGALAMLFVLAFSEKGRELFDRLIRAITPARYEDKLVGLIGPFFDGLHSLRNPADLSFAWFLSTVSWLLEATMYYMIGVAFGLDVGFQYYLLMTAAANLAISVVASQGGIGPFELVTKQTMISAGVTTSAATAYAIGLHALVLLPVIAVGLYFLGTMGLSIGDMFRQSSSPPPREGLAEAVASGYPGEEPRS
ncbi:MAG: lysylphosphatidylglycerol synthase transmembrane domain-containing protein [Dehalococcoidia bacterium]